MSVHDRFEVLDAAAEEAGGRRLVFTFSDARRLRMAVGVAALVVLAGWSLAGLDELMNPLPVDALRRENRILRAQQAALREQAFDLAGQLAGSMARGRRIAWLLGAPGSFWLGQYIAPPSRANGDDTILAWLSDEGMRLAAIGDELMAVPIETGVTRALAPAPLVVGWVTVRVEPALVVADSETARQSGAASAQR